MNANFFQLVKEFERAFTEVQRTHPVSKQAVKKFDSVCEIVHNNISCAIDGLQNGEKSPNDVKDLDELSSRLLEAQTAISPYNASIWAIFLSDFLANIGDAYKILNDLALASKYYERVIVLLKLNSDSTSKLKISSSLAASYRVYANLCMLQGKHTAAEEAYKESIVVLQQFQGAPDSFKEHASEMENLSSTYNHY